MHLSLSTYDLRYLNRAGQLEALDLCPIKNLELYGVPAGDDLAEWEKLVDDGRYRVVCLNASSRVRVIVAAMDEVSHLLSKSIDAASRLGAPFVNIYPGYLSELDVFTNLELFRRRIRPFLDRAESFGVTLLCENYYDPAAYGDDPAGRHFMRHPESILTMLDLVDHPSLGLTWDPCNYYLAGGEPWPFAHSMLKDSIRYVHAKDATHVSPLVSRDPEMLTLARDSITGAFLHVPIGQGALNWDGLIRELVADGYGGFVTLEPHAQDRTEFLQSVSTAIEFFDSRTAAAA